MARSLLVAFASLALCATQTSRAADKADKPALRDGIDKGTKIVVVEPAKDREFPKGAVARVAVDVVGEFTEPVKTGIALLNVKLLAVDTLRIGDNVPRAVTVQLTPTQVEVFDLMKKQGAKLRIRLHEKPKAKK